MKYAVIGCRIFERDISACIATNKNILHSFWLEQGLHDEPGELRRKIQATIDEIEKTNEKFENKYDAILLAYGLCSNGVVGLVARTLALIIPRCDDCMALFLGSQKKYLQAFNSHTGIYWFNKAWVEAGAVPSKEKFARLYKKYLEEYDEDTAEYLVEVETSYVDNYKNAFFIKSKIYDDEPEEKLIRKNAKDFNWKFTVIESDLSFLDNLLNGNWDDKFLVCKPNQITEAEYTGKKITAKNMEPNA